MNGYYQSIQDFFSALNSCGIEYLVLRNYEKILEPEMYMDGHGDVDLLCLESRTFANVIGAKPFHQDDGIHYYVIIGKERVSLDLRCVGDGYYCTKWQQNMLYHRISANGVWVMNEENYFYSLIYHSILQKRSLSQEYANRLRQMATHLGIIAQLDSEAAFISLLEKYMQERGYHYVYPADFMVPLRTSVISKCMIETDYQLAFRHWIFDTKVKTIELIVKIKHLLEGKGFRYA